MKMRIRQFPLTTIKSYMTIISLCIILTFIYAIYEWLFLLLNFFHNFEKMAREQPNMGHLYRIKNYKSQTAEQENNQQLS